MVRSPMFASPRSARPSSARSHARPCESPRLSQRLWAWSASLPPGLRTRNASFKASRRSSRPRIIPRVLNIDNAKSYVASGIAPRSQRFARIRGISSPRSSAFRPTIRSISSESSTAVTWKPRLAKRIECRPTPHPRSITRQGSVNRSSRTRASVSKRGCPSKNSSSSSAIRGEWA